MLMRKNLLLCFVLFCLFGCTRDEEKIDPKNGNDFSLFTTISVESSSLPDSTLCLLFTSYPYEDGSLVVEPSMVAYAPFKKEIPVAKDTEKLYIYFNGRLKEYPRSNIVITPAQAAGGLSLRSATNRPTVVLGTDKLVLSDDLMTAIYDSYPEGRNPGSNSTPQNANVLPADIRKSTDLVAPKGGLKLWITYAGDGGSSMAGSLWYYTYKVDGNKKPTTTLSEVQANKVPVFSNVKASEATYGTRIYLGEFQEGTRIGFLFKGNASEAKYSTPYYNEQAYKTKYPAWDATVSCGVIRLWDYEGESYATMGMENRMYKENAWDGDFNDMIFMLESEGTLLTESTVVPPVIAPESIMWQGYWLFEDQYPKEGDYDFNDLVVKYRIEEPANKPTIIYLCFMAKGARIGNGFGINGKIYYKGLGGFENVYADQENIDQPVKQITIPYASRPADKKYIPMMDNGTEQFNLNTFNPNSYSFPNVLEIPATSASLFKWPLERVRIDVAYPRYKLWVESKCTTNQDWYKDAPVAGMFYDKYE